MGGLTTNRQVLRNEFRSRKAATLAIPRGGVPLRKKILAKMSQKVPVQRFKSTYHDDLVESLWTSTSGFVSSRSL
jgi:hypothetical protein